MCTNSFPKQRGYQSSQAQISLCFDILSILQHDRIATSAGCIFAAGESRISSLLLMLSTCPFLVPASEFSCALWDFFFPTFALGAGMPHHIVLMRSNLFHCKPVPLQANPGKHHNLYNGILFISSKEIPSQHELSKCYIETCASVIIIYVILDTGSSNPFLHKPLPLQARPGKHHLLPVHKSLE